MNVADMELQKRIDDACWIGAEIFNRNKTTGSSANMSFIYKEKIYVTCSGSCFGRLTDASFSITDMEGNLLEGPQPSKELPIHLMMYKKTKGFVQAVIHVHSHFATLWSCLPHEDAGNVIPSYTPYLEMKLGKIRLIPYAKPGSEELFSHFKENLNEGNGYLLAHHGPVVGGTDLRNAFFGLEELEESARIAWELRNVPNVVRIS